MLLDIVQLGNPILHQPAKAVELTEITSPYIQNLIEEMKETMRAAPGVGLAAPQVRVSLQIAVIEDCEERMSGMLPEIRQERGRQPIVFHVIINPTLTILDLDEEKAHFFEACLSVAGTSRITPRASRVKVDCWDEKGQKKIIEASGWYARILQHEIDHLNGKLYIDIADKRTEIVNDEVNRQKWMNAQKCEIMAFYNERCC
jgi:peptide deformylase